MCKVNVVKDFKSGQIHPLTPTACPTPGMAVSFYCYMSDFSENCCKKAERTFVCLEDL